MNQLNVDSSRNSTSMWITRWLSCHRPLTLSSQSILIICEGISFPSIQDNSLCGNQHRTRITAIAVLNWLHPSSLLLSLLLAQGAYRPPLLWLLSSHFCFKLSLLYRLLDASNQLAMSHLQNKTLFLDIDIGLEFEDDLEIGKNWLFCTSSPIISIP